MNGTLTDVPGFLVGHYTDTQAVTGCTIVICPPDTLGAVDVRGGAPGTRETDLLNPQNRVEHVTAVMLSGGSAYGLASATGAMRYLRERELGYRSGTGFLVPIVPAAILFDLGIGDGSAFPDEAAGYAACENASDASVPQGSVGAGTGAALGMLQGKAFGSKGGIGSASRTLRNGVVVGAVIAVNAVGDVIDSDGTILAGLRGEQGEFVGMLNAMQEMMVPPADNEATVIGVVATNAKLSKAQAKRVAVMAHDGIARAVNPSHTPFDGDALFVLASGQIEIEPAVVGAMAAEVVSEAIRNGIRAATTLDGLRAAKD